MFKPIYKITNIRDYCYCVGKIILFCQCIENDIKLIYYGMLNSISDDEKAQINKWTLGKTILKLESLDKSDDNPYFSASDYKLLKSVNSIRNYYAHHCYIEFSYEQSKNFDIKFEKAANRLAQDHNLLAKIYILVEKARLEFFGR